MLLYMATKIIDSQSIYVIERFLLARVYNPRQLASDRENNRGLGF